MGFGGRTTDRCKIGTKAAASPGEPTAAYSYGAAIRCRFKWMTPHETKDTAGAGPNVVPGIAFNQAEIRVPPGTTVATTDRVQLTQRRNGAVSPAEFYAIMGKPHITPTQLVLNCQLIEGTSAK